MLTSASDVDSDALSSTQRAYDMSQTTEAQEAHRPLLSFWSAQRSPNKHAEPFLARSGNVCHSMFE